MKQICPLRKTSWPAARFQRLVTIIQSRALVWRLRSKSLFHYSEERENQAISPPTESHFISLSLSPFSQALIQWLVVGATALAAVPPREQHCRVKTKGAWRVWCKLPAWGLRPESLENARHEPAPGFISQRWCNNSNVQGLNVDINKWTSLQSRSLFPTETVLAAALAQFRGIFWLIWKRYQINILQRQ